MEAFDVVIIGSGFAGASTAFHLVRRGVRDVLVLERETRAGVHASGQNAALLFQLLKNADEARLVAEGRRVFAAPPADLAERPLLRTTGSLLVTDPAGEAALRTLADEAGGLDVPVSLLPGDEAVRRIPALDSSGITQALDCPGDGVVDIAALLEGYLGGARRGGASVRFGEDVRAIDHSGGRIEGVTTSRGTIATRCVVDAAGAWAGVVGELAGVGDGGLVPHRRHLYETTAPIAVDPGGPFVWHDRFDVYFRPHGEGLLMSPCDETPHPAETPVSDPATERVLRDKLGLAFPRLREARVRAVRTCLRTFAPDRRFRIGADPALDGFFWVAALGGHGMSTSWGVGRLAAEAISGVHAADVQEIPGRT